MRTAKPIFLGIGFYLVFLCAGDVMAEESSFDPAVQNDLETAYAIAQTFFTDAPGGTLQMSDLQGYGFRSTEDVSIQIVEGRKDRLLMTGKRADGVSVYAIDKAGKLMVRSLGAETSSPARIRPRR
jgi:hypothetical protein